VASAGADAVRLTAWVSGRVQGVGFRWWTRNVADELGLDGWAENLPDGRVEVVAEGPRERLEQLLEVLGSDAGPGRVTGLTHRWGTASGGLARFRER
jgi:acylphosphatase